MDAFVKRYSVGLACCCPFQCSSSTSTFQVDPTTPEERRAWFAAHGPDHPVLVFEDNAIAMGPRVAGGAIAGWASLNPYHPREAYGHTVELSIYVRHEQRRHGVGRALLGELLALARASRHHVVLAQVAADQEASLALHRSFGFREVGRLHEVGFKFGRWLDVILFDHILPLAQGTYTPTSQECRISSSSA